MNLGVLDVQIKHKSGDESKNDLELQIKKKDREKFGIKSLTIITLDFGFKRYVIKMGEGDSNCATSPFKELVEDVAERTSNDVVREVIMKKALLEIKDVFRLSRCVAVKSVHPTYKMSFDVIENEVDVAKGEERSIQLYAKYRNEDNFYIAEFDEECNDFIDDLDFIFKEKDSTEREILSLARIGQGQFRRNVIQLWGLGSMCALSNVGIPELLIASHIIPWSECDNKLRLDGANGIMLCAHVDKLFDRHLIGFVQNDVGEWLLEINSQLDIDTLNSIGIYKGMRLNTEFIKRDQESYDRLSSNLQSHYERFLNFK